MVIRASSRQAIDALIADLSSHDEVAREAAVARLTVIGPRAADRLVRVVDSGAPAAARAAALQVLEASADPRGLEPALRALADRHPDVASAAAAAARVFLTGPNGHSAVDRLTATALDRTRDSRVRTAALQALATLAASTLQPLWTRLQGDPDPAIRRLVESRASSSPSRDFAGEIIDASERALPDDPAPLGEAIATTAGSIALTALHRLIERVREREAAEAREVRRAEWARVRGAAHAALAARGSRVALYDLRESIAASSTPLPVEFLAALADVGDATCLEPIAAAYARSRDEWWRRHLADAFRAIVARERLTRRHAVMKRIERKWPEIIASR